MRYDSALTRLHRGLPSRLLLLWAALVFLMVQVESLHHSLLTFHVVCAEHGQIVEDLPAVVQTAPAQPLSYSKSAPPARHHACDLPPGAEAGATRPSGATLVATSAENSVDPGLSPPATPIRAGPPLLRLAPKSSPPRA